MSYRVYSSRPSRQGRTRSSRRSRSWRDGYWYEQGRREYRRAKIEKAALEFEQFYGGTRGRSFYAESKAVYSSTLVYTSQYNFDEEENRQMPILFTQFVIKPYDTMLFTTGNINTWDRFRVTKIRLEYIPTGTEAIVASLIVQNQGTYPNAPYANLPIYFSYDPTANVATMAQALEGSKRFEYPPTTGNPPRPNPQELELHKQRYRTIASEAMKLSQTEVGSTTDKFRSEVVDPRCMQFSETGPTSSSVQNSVLDVSSQLTPENNTPQGRQGKLLATYGTFNISVPRILYSDTTPTIRVNVVATFSFELYGDR